MTPYMKQELIPSSINQYMVGLVHSLHMQSELNPKKKLYCDTVVRTGTPCTGTVRTCTSRTSGQPVIYSHVSLFFRIHRYCSLLCSVLL